MNDSLLQLAKREVQEMFHSRVTWTCLLAVGVILGLAGPFGTEAVMSVVPRLLYWTALCAAFFFIGTFVGNFVNGFLTGLGLPFWPSILLSGAAAGAVIFASLVAINIALFGVWIDCVPCLLKLGANVIGISMIVSAAFVQVKLHMTSLHAAQTVEQSQAALQGTPDDNAAQPPSILRRLPLEKRGALVSLSVSDHYVQIVTDKGQDLVLMRLSDAIDEVGDTPGLQVHRSHWVALAQIVSARREGAKAVLTMSDGRDIPASRTYVAALREAGVLPGPAKDA